MAVSPYFQHVDAIEEQDLWHDLAEESIYLTGVNVYYIDVDNQGSADWEKLFGENRFEVLDNATEIEMYMDNFENPYAGNGDLFSKFGLSLNQTVSFKVAYRRFNELFAHRPQEGDYIYVPGWESVRAPADIFRVVYVDDVADQFQPLGSPVFWTIKCERATFSHQTVTTGIPEIDDSVTQEQGVVAEVDDSTKIETVADLFINFDESNPFGSP